MGRQGSRSLLEDPLVPPSAGADPIAGNSSPASVHSSTRAAWSTGCSLPPHRGKHPNGLAAALLVVPIVSPTLGPGGARSGISWVAETNP